MWWRETKRCWAVMPLIEQYILLFVKRRLDAEHRLALPLPRVVDTSALWAHTIDDRSAPPCAAAPPVALRDAANVTTPSPGRTVPA
jgi:hypothetical protein